MVLGQSCIHTHVWHLQFSIDKPLGDSSPTSFYSKNTRAPQEIPISAFEKQGKKCFIETMSIISGTRFAMNR